MQSDHYLLGESSCNKIVEERMQRWEETLGSKEKLQRRLDWEEWDVVKVRRALGDNIQFNENTETPSWAKILNNLINVDTINEEFRLKPDETTLPFEDILSLFLQTARVELFLQLKIQSIHASPLAILSEKAYQNLERSLLERLKDICTPVLDNEFNTVRPAGYGLLSSMMGSVDNPTKTYYNHFVNIFLRPENKLIFFQRYPVLGRLIATAIEYWVTFVVEFLHRLEADLDDIHHTFPAIQKCRKIAMLQASLSDPHHQGRAVIELTFENKQKLVYKPKSLALTIIYYELLQWCNHQDEKYLPFKTTCVLERDNYGWEEFIAYSSCEDEASAKRFYERAGKLLCVLYILGATDCHFQNLIAQGEHLFLIDTETLLYPFTILNEDTFLEGSVLNIGLLPRWRAYSKGEAYDVGGLGCPDRIQGKQYSKKWKYLNTDYMFLVEEETQNAFNGLSIPMLNGKQRAAADYLQEFLSGFQVTYSFFTKHKQNIALLAILEKFSRCQSRIVCRDTQLYYIILQNSLLLNCMRDGIDRSIELENLSRAFLVEDVKPDYWLILLTELTMMHQMDIPHFTTSLEMNSLGTLTHPIKKFCKISGYQLVLNKLTHLSDLDLAQQIFLIKGTFYTQTTFSHGATSVSINTPSKSYPSSTVEKNDLLALTTKIANKIQFHSFEDKEGNARWVTPIFDSKVDHLQFQPVSDNLYDGNIGIALFLAALDFVTQKNEFHDLTHRTLQRLQHCLKKNNSTIRRQLLNMGLSALTGVGSLVYGLAHISQFLKEPYLLDNALQIANLITPQDIEADKHLDILGGSAGLIMSFLTLFEKTGERILLDKAIVCGQHLLKLQKNYDNKFLVWFTGCELPLTGFSHGAAGISYALLSLYAATQDDAYLKAAKTGMEFERAVFSKAHTNWPDFRLHRNSNEECTSYMTTWCHGAPGIALARLGGMSVLNTPLIQNEITHALQTTKQYVDSQVQHLCCGNFGRLETVWVAALQQNNHELKKEAINLLARILTQEKNFYTSENIMDPSFNPGFFQGAAGIGYQLLRMAEPEKLPCVLLLEGAH